jgi:hypothetical protein
MPAQNYANHRRYVPMFHYVLFALLLITFIGSCVNLYESCGDHQRIYSASLISVLSFCGLLFFYFVRTFPLRAQDRAIRAEEQFRHFVMTGKPLDSRLTLRQIIGLRFASDEEFLALAKRAVDEKLSEDAIKRAVKVWKADEDRA